LEPAESDLFSDGSTQMRRIPAGVVQHSYGQITGGTGAYAGADIVAYFYYVGNAFLISYLPHPETSGDLVPRVHFRLASTIEYRTLFVSWFALRPLLGTYGLHHPADVLAVLLPLSLALGSVVIAMAADGLGLMRLRETYRHTSRQQSAPPSP